MSTIIQDWRYPHVTRNVKNTAGDYTSFAVASGMIDGKVFEFWYTANTEQAARKQAETHWEATKKKLYGLTTHVETTDGPTGPTEWPPQVDKYRSPV